MLTEQTFVANEVPINYTVEGVSDHPMLLLHGITERWQTFLPLISYLLSKWQVYAIDLRGHGKSGRVKNRYRIIDYAQDVISFIELRIGQRAVILGHSVGALVSIYIAANRPDLVPAVILVEPPLHLQHTPLAAIQNGPYEVFRQIVEIIRANESQAAIEQGLIKHFHQEGNSDALRARAEVLSQLDPDALTLSLESQHLAGLDLDALLTQIECPSLLIQGNPEKGAALFDEDITRALALLRHGERVSIRDGGHMVHQSHPETIAESVNNFYGKRM